VTFKTLKNIPTIPWVSGSAWQEVNRILRYQVNRYENLLENAFTCTRGISEIMEFLFPRMEELCISTCPLCPDPCCLHATVWFDFKDLVFLHLAGFETPSGQLISNKHEPCRYLGPKGCFLDRNSRPFICTWYLCPSQREFLQKNMKKDEKPILASIRAVKTLRKEMEEAFIRITS
jgi:hypothetical protein